MARPEAPFALRTLAVVALLAECACAGPLAHVPTESRWLDPSTGRGSALTPPRVPEGDAPLRVVVYGDTRGNRDVHRSVVDAILHAKPDLVLFTGDALSCLPLAHMPDFGLANYIIPFWPQVHPGYPGVTFASVMPFPALLHETIFSGIAQVRDDTGFNGFLEDTAPLRLGARVPYLFAPGNHDVYHDVDRREATRLFGDAGHLYRAFDVGDRYRFIVLDTGSDLFLSHDPMPAGGEQLRWLDATLADAEARGMRTVITMHLPPYSSGAEDGPVPWVEERVVKSIFDHHRVDLVTCGHAHAYERVQRRGFKGQMVNYVVTGGGGAPFHHEDERAPGSVIFASATSHYVLVELTRSHMHIRMIPVSRPGEVPSEDRPDDVTIDLPP